MPIRRGPLPALAAAACVLAVLYAQQLIVGVATVIATPLFGQTLSFSDTLGSPTVLYSILFALGVFLALWLIVPVSAEFRLTRVVLRGLGISALATALLFVIAALISLFQAFVGPLGSMTGFDGRVAADGVGGALLTAATSFAFGAPLVILAVVLLWIWQRRRTNVTSV
ncbi:MAG: hypothetical protein JWN80_1731 [Microbacteriaceae bacterium]|nr:hypothetical protein [Microbacteriaceae bacterium]